MGKIEENILEQFIAHIIFWKRFIDDIFFIFIGSEQQLKATLESMNNIHNTIRFTYNYSRTSVDFLDTTLYIDTDRKIRTKLYRKPTDTMCLLHHTSNHSQACKRSVIFSQALRYNMIIHNDNHLNEELHILARTLLARGYPLKLINDNIHRALTFTQQDLLNPRVITPRKRILPLITPYSVKGQKLAEHVKTNWGIIKNDETLREIWPNPPTIAYTKTKSIKDTLIHTAQGRQ